MARTLCLPVRRSAARIARAGPGRSIALLRTVPQMEVTKQAHFGTVVKDLQARVQDLPCHRCIGEPEFVKVVEASGS